MIAHIHFSKQEVQEHREYFGNTPALLESLIDTAKAKVSRSILGIDIWHADINSDGTATVTAQYEPEKQSTPAYEMTDIEALKMFVILAQYA